MFEKLKERGTITISESANSTFDSDIGDLLTSSEHESLKDVALECSVCGSLTSSVRVALTCVHRTGCAYWYTV